MEEERSRPPWWVLTLVFAAGVAVAWIGGARHG
jgi:hypothetical protein